MSATYPRFGKEEYGHRGDDVYERQIRSLVEEKHTGQIVALDIDTGEFEVDTESLLAAGRLQARLPNAQIWCVRVGEPGVDRIGSGASGVRS